MHKCTGTGKCTHAWGQKNAHTHGNRKMHRCMGGRKMHTCMGIGKCTSAWGQKNAHTHGSRKMHKYMGTGKCTRAWKQENAQVHGDTKMHFAFILIQGVTVSFSHWLRSDLTVFHDLLVLKELAQRKRSRREKGPCLIHFSSENTAGPLCKLRFY